MGPRKPHPQRPGGAGPDWPPGTCCQTTLGICTEWGGGGWCVGVRVQRGPEAESGGSGSPRVLRATKWKGELGP